MNKYREIGDRLKQLRGPMTQLQFAKKVGVSLPALQNYEAGKRVPKGDVLYRIAAIEERSVDWILNGKERELTMDDAREFVRRHLWIEKQANPKYDYTEEDVEREAARYLSKLTSAKPAPIVTETHARYGIDDIAEKLLLMLKDMDEKSKRDVLKYTEEKKQLTDLLKKSKKDHVK